MSATYKFLNGGTYKVLSPAKAAAVLVLTASDGRTKTFPHEFQAPEGELITAEEINRQANLLAWDFDQNPQSELPNVVLEFNTEIEVTPPESEEP